MVLIPMDRAATQLPTVSNDPTPLVAVPPQSFSGRSLPSPPSPAAAQLVSAAQPAASLRRVAAAPPSPALHVMPSSPVMARRPATSAAAASSSSSSYASRPSSHFPGVSPSIHTRTSLLRLPADRSSNPTLMSSCAVAILGDSLWLLGGCDDATYDMEHSRGLEQVDNEDGRMRYVDLAEARPRWRLAEVDSDDEDDVAELAEPGCKAGLSLVSLPHRNQLIAFGQKHGAMEYVTGCAA